MWLLDWEDASWAPPGADAVHAAAAWTVLFGTPEPDGPEETLDFWIDRIRARPDAAESFSRSMIRVLERKRRGPAR
jgi:hypothetical protein